MNIRRWEERGKHFQYNNHEIFYQDEDKREGEKEILVCIHGFPTSSWDWKCIWPQLTQKFRVIAADMIGFGFSDKPYNYMYSINDQATLHEKLLESLGVKVKSIHILAHDYGVSVAQELLARYEDRKREGIVGIEIKSICFLNGGLFPETHHPRLVQKLLLSPIGYLVSYLMSEKRFNRSFGAIFGKDTKPSEKELKEFWEIVSNKKGLKISHKIIGYMEERKKYRRRWVGVLEKTKVVLRLINGGVDPVSGAHIAARYEELIPNADIIVLPTIGHYPQIEDPARVWEALNVFWQKL